MDRGEEIQKIGKQIQKKLDRLKELNCSLDSSWHTIGIFDNTIDMAHSDDASDCPQIVYSFDTSG